VTAPCRANVAATSPGTSRSINRDSFTDLAADDDARRLIMNWFDRANGLTDQQGDPFESFIYAWIAFNGWAALCSREDQDRAQLKAIESDGSLQSGFKALLREDSNFQRWADEFHDQWPIFKAAQIRSKRVRQVSPDRRKCLDHYRAAGIDRAPDCYYERHVDAGKPCPLDWAHTLEAIYRVRCNLFHGEKSAGSEEDKAIVRAANNTLVPILKWLLGVPGGRVAYYQEWAARLNVPPELVADPERIAGKPIGDMIVEDSGTTLRQMSEDAELLGTAMARHGADNLGRAGRRNAPRRRRLRRPARRPATSRHHPDHEGGSAMRHRHSLFRAAPALLGAGRRPAPGDSTADAST
jgi:hypothetical protein